MSIDLFSTSAQYGLPIVNVLPAQLVRNYHPILADVDLASVMHILVPSAPLN